MGGPHTRTPFSAEIEICRHEARNFKVGPLWWRERAPVLPGRGESSCARELILGALEAVGAPHTARQRFPWKMRSSTLGPGRSKWVLHGGQRPHHCYRAVICSVGHENRYRARSKKWGPPTVSIRPKRDTPTFRPRHPPKPSQEPTGTYSRRMRAPGTR